MSSGPAVDVRSLTPAAAARLLNSTPLGTVTRAATVRAHRDAAGLRIAPDGRHVDLVRYVAWLVGELEQADARAADRDQRATAAADRYVEARRLQAQRNREATKAAQDIWPIPEIADVARRARCAESLRAFCETYFAPAFWRPWSDDHLRVIAKLERAVREGGLFAFAMPRGSGKTTLARAAALWAVLYGYRPYVCLIGGSRENARELLRPVQVLILEDPLMLADFPEAVYPLRRLENSSKRQGQQHVRGQLTHVHWGLHKLVFPTLRPEHLPEALRDRGAAPAAGAIITATSLDSHLRGQQHTRPDGTVVRPALVLLDDPQTRESARSADQTDKCLRLIRGDVLGLAGPGQTISCLLTCTVTYAGDVADTLLDAEKSPEWEAERTKMVLSWPADEKLWDTYFQIRAARGPTRATAYYRRHRAAMDAGAAVAWPARYDAELGEISAIQHAMNLRHRMRDAFAAECQNEPDLGQADDQVLTVDQVMAAVTGCPRGEVPGRATRLTAFIDIHDRLLFWCVCGWEEDFAAGHVVDYGAWPDQRRSRFTAADCTRTLTRQYPGRGTDGAILAGLEELAKQLLGRPWARGGGGRLPLSRLLIDAGYKPDLAAAAQQRVGSTAITLAKGVGIRASRRPIAAYIRRPGERIGDHWYMPNTRRTNQWPYVLVDVNHWKSFVHRGLATAQGDPGAIGLFGRSSTAHALFAEHVARSERWVEVTGPYGTVREWSNLPGRPDNHWFDCLVGCAAAASIEGLRLRDQVDRARRPRKRYTAADLQRGRTVGR